MVGKINKIYNLSQHSNSPVESILESLCDGGEIRRKSDYSAVVLHHVQRDRLPKLVGLRQTRDGR